MKSYDTKRKSIGSANKKWPPDKIPFEIRWRAFTPLLMKTFRENTGTDLTPEEYFDFDTRFVLPLPSRMKTDFSQYFNEPLSENISFDEWGIGLVPTLYEIPDYKYHTLESMSIVEEINNYICPDLAESYRYSLIASQTKEFHKIGYAVCGELYQTIFETAWLMRNMETFLLDLILNPDIAHTICENITLIRIKQARLYAKAGVDIIRLDDDIVSQQGLMMSHETYNTYFKNRIKRIIQEAKEVNSDVIIFMHSCGKVEDVIDDFIEVGVEVLNPVQPECDLLEIYR
jgi:uroporphyrinogen decarboxylase